MSRLPRPTSAVPTFSGAPDSIGRSPIAALNIASSKSSDVPPPRIKPNNPFASPQRANGAGSRLPGLSPIKTPLSASRAGQDHQAFAPAPTSAGASASVITPPGRRPVPYSAHDIPRDPSPGPSAGPATASACASGSGPPRTGPGYTTPLRLPSPLGRGSGRLPPTVPLSQPRSALRQRQPQLQPQPHSLTHGHAHAQAQSGGSPSTPALRVPHRGLPSSAPAHAGSDARLRRVKSVVLLPVPTAAAIAAHDGNKADSARLDGQHGPSGRQRVVTEPGEVRAPGLLAQTTPDRAKIVRERRSLDLSAHRSESTSPGAQEEPIVMSAALAIPPESVRPPPPFAASDQPTLQRRPSQAFSDVGTMSVPPHVADRLRLIHHLTSTLGINASEVSGRIDVPGLLARVEQAYEKRNASVPGIHDRSNSSEGREKGGDASTGFAGKKGMWGRFKRLGKKAGADTSVSAAMGSTGPSANGPAFGVPLHDLPLSSLCTSLIGGQRHDLPIIVFTVSEEIYRRGMSQAGIFRLSGDPERIGQLTKGFNLPPSYGDGLDLEWEPIHNLTGLVKRWLRDLPEPVLDEAILPALLDFCVDQEGLPRPLGSDETHVSHMAGSSHIKAAQILLKLLPPMHFSLLIYLLAFLGQLPLFADNRLNIDSISIIFGPALCAPRSRGVPGLGSATQAGAIDLQGDRGPKLVQDSQRALAWLLAHWSTISERILETVDELCSTNVSEEKVGIVADFNPSLLSPVDIRLPHEIRQIAQHHALDVFSSAAVDHEQRQAFRGQRRASIDVQRSHSEQSWHSMSSAYSDGRTSPVPHASPQSDSGISVAAARHKRSPTSGSLFARAMGTLSDFSGGRRSVDLPRRNSTTSIVSEASGETEKRREPKRSSSYSSLASAITVKDVVSPKRPKSRASFDSTRGLSRNESRQSLDSPDVTQILGSLHGLLVAKDKQIERDARELAGLRSSLQDMDERLKRASVSDAQLSPAPESGGHSPAPHTPRHGTCVCGHQASTPQITITASASSPSNLAETSDHEKHILDLQAQLSTAMSALDASRQTNDLQAARVRELEKIKMRLDLDHQNDLRQLETELALERAKVVGLTEERDVAKQRLERIKTTLFSVS